MVERDTMLAHAVPERAGPRPQAPVRRTLRLVETPYYSLRQGTLAEGCERCVRGEKLVLFVTGMCPANCFYCPISPEKKMCDVVFANERQLEGSEAEMIAALIEEAEQSRATGAGITGGDPLARLSRTCSFIRALKARFGPAFHIHLYTTPILVNENSLQQLADAGLDEIRFHPLEDESRWPQLLLAKRHSWTIGFEIPVIPDNTRLAERIIDFAAEHKIVSFLNLNELEISELNETAFAMRRYAVKSSGNYGIEGCREAAIELMGHAARHGIPVHYCTTTLKDRVQMGNRLKRRAEHDAKPFDIVEEGLLTRGAIYCTYPPLGSYGKILKAMRMHERRQELVLLERIVAWLRELGMPDDAGMIDEKRVRIILNAEALREIASELLTAFPDAHPYIVTEYPTSDAWIVEAVPLGRDS